MALARHFLFFPRLGKPLRAALQRAGAVVALLALLLQAFAPGAAQAQDGMIAVICGADGPVEVRMNADGEVDEAPCPECGDCPSCLLLSAPYTLPSGSVPFGLQFAAGTSPRSPDSPNSENPAQFWPENRGPPLFTQVQSGLACRTSLSSEISGGQPWT